MTNILHKRGEAGPYLKTVDGEALLMSDGPKWVTTDILDTEYILMVDGGYLFDMQPDAPSQRLGSSTGYPLQASSATVE